MDSKIVDTICNQIYRRFPEVIGKKPNVQPQQANGSPNYLLTFRGSATTADGKRIHRIVRVVTNEKGKIIKVTTSR